MVLQHDIENLRHSANDLHGEVGHMRREFDRLKMAMERNRGDN